MDFEKTVRIGNGDSGSIFCRIKFNRGILSISGVEGPLASGNARGGCGQILMSYKEHDARGYKTIDSITPAPGWDKAKIVRFFEVWDEWHLNDMCAGTPAQDAELKKHTFPGYPTSHYEWASKILKDAGLNPDNGHKYGHAWLRREVPADVIEFLRSLPDRMCPTTKYGIRRLSILR